MNCSIAEILLKNIDFSDRTFQISYPHDDMRIQNSIFEFGFLSVPVVKQKNGKFIVISGFRRLISAQKTNLKSAPCIITGMDDYSAFRFAVIDNASQRALNIFEVADIIEKLSSVFNIADTIIASEFLPVLGYPPAVKLIDRLRFAGKFSPQQKSILYQSGVEFEKIIALRDIDSSIWDSAIAIITQLKPGVNKFNQIIELINEISQRENISQKEVLEKNEIKSVMDNMILTAPQKTDRLRNALLVMRNPRFAEFEDQYLKKLKKLNLDRRLKLVAPQSFEGETFKMEIAFTNAQELKRSIGELNNLSEKKEFGELLDFVNDIG